MEADFLEIQALEKIIVTTDSKHTFFQPSKYWNSSQRMDFIAVITK